MTLEVRKLVSANGIEVHTPMTVVDPGRKSRIRRTARPTYGIPRAQENLPTGFSSRVDAEAALAQLGSDNIDRVWRVQRGVHAYEGGGVALAQLTLGKQIVTIGHRNGSGSGLVVLASVGELASNTKWLGLDPITSEAELIIAINATVAHAEHRHRISIARSGRS